MSTSLLLRLQSRRCCLSSLVFFAFPDGPLCFLTSLLFFSPVADGRNNRIKIQRDLQRSAWGRTTLHPLPPLPASTMRMNDIDTWQKAVSSSR